MANTLEVVVIGAGIGGTVTAFLLKRQGINVRIYERDAHVSARTQGFSLTIQENGIEALRKCGVFDKLTPTSTENNLHAYASDGRILFTLPEKVWQIERENIRDVFLEELKNQGIPVHYNSRCVGFEEKDDKVTVRFEDGKVDTCDILVAADGHRSIIRKEMNFPNDELRYLGLFSLGFNVPTTHRAWELFKDETAVTTGKGIRVISKANSPHMIVALTMAMADGEAEERWPNTEDMVRDFKQAFIDQGFHNAEAIKALDLKPETRYYRDRDPLKLWDVGRVVLIGDACHPMSPFMGQGANLAMMDALDLSDAVGKIAAGEDAKTSLQEFQRIVLERSAAIVLKARNIAWAYTWQNPIACWFRDTLLSFFFSRRSSVRVWK